MKEVWVKYFRYPSYEFSNLGRIKIFNWKGFGVERIIKPALDANGYLRTVLKDLNGVNRTIKVHRVICAAFRGEYGLQFEVNHLDFNKSNNCIDNIYWVSRKENVRHMIDNGRFYFAVGDKNGFAKLTEKDVIEIRAKYKPFVVTRKELTSECNVTLCCIKDVLQRRTWNHLP